MEAGQSLDQSMADASRSLQRTHPDLSAELAQLYLELKTATSRADSFHAFGARSKEPELRKLANLLADSDRFGTSIGPALRSHSKYLRTRFRQQAQERARKVGVKLIFPVFFLIFPSVLLVTLGSGLHADVPAVEESAAVAAAPRLRAGRMEHATGPDALARLFGGDAVRPVQSGSER